MIIVAAKFVGYYYHYHEACANPFPLDIDGGIVYESGTIEQIISQSSRRVDYQISYESAPRCQIRHPGNMALLTRYISIDATIGNNGIISARVNNPHHRYNWIMMDMLENHPTIETRIEKPISSVHQRKVAGLLNGNIVDISTPGAAPALLLMFWVEVHRVGTTIYGWEFEARPESVISIAYDIESDEVWYLEDDVRYTTKLTDEARSYLNEGIEIESQRLLSDMSFNNR